MRPLWFDEGPPRAVRKSTPFPFRTHRTMAEAMRDEEGCFASAAVLSWRSWTACAVCACAVHAVPETPPRMATGWMFQAWFLIAVMLGNSESPNSRHFSTTGIAYPTEASCLTAASDARNFHIFSGNLFFPQKETGNIGVMCVRGFTRPVATK